jgi:hypothetical protein
VGAATNVVLDNLTGLMWARDAGMMKTNWAAGVSYCTNLSYGGYSDWRMPNRQEIDSLLDLGRSNPALPAGHPFRNVQLVDVYWASTTYAPSAGSAWFVSFYGGDWTYDTKGTQKKYIWPVRGGE